VIDTMWSGSSVTACSGIGSKDSAAADRSWPTCASASGTGPIVSTFSSLGHFSSRPSTRSTNIGTGSMVIEVISASLMT
jgi:hypothetical protein